MMRNGILILVAPVMVIGCNSDRVPVYPVHGKVTFEGKPMPWGGSISLFPLKNQPGKAAGAEIKPDGTYRLSTHGDGDGSMAGEFRVVITQVTHKEPENTGDDGKAPVRVAPELPANQHIPPIYSDSQQSPLKMTVEAKSDNEINFDLKRK